MKRYFLLTLFSVITLGAFAQKRFGGRNVSIRPNVKLASGFSSSGLRPNVAPRLTGVTNKGASSSFNSTFVNTNPSFFPRSRGFVATHRYTPGGGMGNSFNINNLNGTTMKYGSMKPIGPTSDNVMPAAPVSLSKKAGSTPFGNAMKTK